MRKNLFSRSWYYFRNGWGTYFAFVFAAINTLVTTYYLAIKHYPPLQEIFPSFSVYVVIITLIGIPILVLVGYLHYKKTTAYKSEIDILYESNPYVRRTLVNSELILTLNMVLLEKLIKQSNSKELTDIDIDEITKIHHEIKVFMEERGLSNSKDLEFFKKIINH